MRSLYVDINSEVKLEVFNIKMLSLVLNYSILKLSFSYFFFLSGPVVPCAVYRAVGYIGRIFEKWCLLASLK